MQTELFRTSSGSPFGLASRHALVWLVALREGLQRAGSAHARRAALDAMPSELLRDTGLTPEAATGNPRHQPDLPFFMQSGFGRR